MMKRVSTNYNNVHGKMSDSSSTTTSCRDEEVVWEMRPGGMLVQKRDDNVPVVPHLNIRLRIAFGALRYEIFVNSQSTFGKTNMITDSLYEQQIYEFFFLLHLCHVHNKL